MTVVSMEDVGEDSQEILSFRFAVEDFRFGFVYLYKGGVEGFSLRASGQFIPEITH